MHKFIRSVIDAGNGLALNGMYGSSPLSLLLRGTADFLGGFTIISSSTAGIDVSTLDVEANASDSTQIADLTLEIEILIEL